MKKKTLEELQDEFNSLTRKRNQMIIDLDTLTKEMVGLAEKVYENSPEYVKIVCLQCNGKGTVDGENDKLIKCPMCSMHRYMWVKRYVDENEKI